MCFIGFPQHSFFHSTEPLTDCSNVGIYSHFNACVVERGVLTDEELSKLGTWDGSESVMPHKGLQGEPSSKRSRGPRRRPATETSLPLRCRDTASELHWALWARKAV